MGGGGGGEITWLWCLLELSTQEHRVDGLASRPPQTTGGTDETVSHPQVIPGLGTTREKPWIKGHGLSGSTPGQWGWEMLKNMHRGKDGERRWRSGRWSGDGSGIAELVEHSRFPSISLIGSIYNAHDVTKNRDSKRCGEFFCLCFFFFFFFFSKEGQEMVCRHCS